MKIKKLLEELLAYYSVARMVGHTEAIALGAGQVKEATVLVNDADTGNYLCHNFTIRQSQILTLGQFQANGLRGRKVPLLIDNGAQVSLMIAALKEINRLESEIERLNKEIQNGK